MWILRFRNWNRDGRRMLYFFLVWEPPSKQSKFGRSVGDVIRFELSFVACVRTINHCDCSYSPHTHSVYGLITQSHVQSNFNRTFLQFLVSSYSPIIIFFSQSSVKQRNGTKLRTVSIRCLNTNLISRLFNGLMLLWLEIFFFPFYFPSIFLFECFGTIERPGLSSFLNFWWTIWHLIRVSRIK